MLSNASDITDFWYVLNLKELRPSDFAAWLWICFEWVKKDSSTQNLTLMLSTDLTPFNVFKVSCGDVKHVYGLSLLPI